MSVSATQSVLVGVSDLEKAIGLFHETIGMQVEWRGPAPANLLRAWRIAPGTTAELLELSMNGYPFGRLRLAAFTPTPTVRVRSDGAPHAPDSPLDIGPKAIDFYVRDPIGHAFNKMLRSGYPARSVPRKHTIGHSISEEVLFTGPDDLPILLMVGHKHSPLSLRPGSPEGEFSELATCSVISGDLARSRAFYGEALGLVPVNDAETGPDFRDLVCELVDAPRGTRVHFLLFAQKDQPSGKILLVHFHDVARKRLTDRMRPGHLGFSLFSHGCDDLDGLHARLGRLGFEVVTAPTAVNLPNGSQQRIMLAKGPNEEMFEFVEGRG